MITVALLQPETPENIGFICRAMKNFDLIKLILIDPQCDYKDEKALKTSKHAKDILKKSVTKPYDYFKKLKNDFDVVIGTTSVLGRDYNIPRTPVTPDKLFEKVKNEKVAIVFGREGSGLNNEEIKECDIITTIPSSKKYPALNISHAAIIIFYELYKKLGEKKVNEHIEPASSQDKEILMMLLDDLLDSLDFSTEEKKETQRITWKRLFNQAMLSKREAFAVMGLLRKINESNNS